jgi:hypothetical protein
MLTFSCLASEVVLGASYVATLVNKCHSERVAVGAEAEGIDVNHAGITCARTTTNNGLCSIGKVGTTLKCWLSIK